MANYQPGMGPWQFLGSGDYPLQGEFLTFEPYGCLSHSYSRLVSQGSAEELRHHIAYVDHAAPEEMVCSIHKLDLFGVRKPLGQEPEPDRWKVVVVLPADEQLGL